MKISLGDDVCLGMVHVYKLKMESSKFPRMFVSPFMVNVLSEGEVCRREVHIPATSTTSLKFNQGKQRINNQV